MVHALRRVRKHLKRHGNALLIQPHQHRRPSIAITSPRNRQPVAELINPVFQPLIDNAVASIRTVVDERRFIPLSTTNHKFSVRLPNPHQLHAYMHTGIRPPRFPAGGKRRLDALWKTRPEKAQIEVTEFMTLILMQAGPVD